MAIVDPSRLLITVNPTLAAQWHSTKNIDLSLETVYANSGKKAWWQCPTCDYEWSVQIASRNRGNGCPYCAGKIANETNSVVSLYPEIAAQYANRNTKPVETLTTVSHKKVWWQCDDNPDHDWEAMVMNRVRQGDGCPYCSGRYPTKDNNLAVKYPELIPEFNLKKNFPLTPYTITPSSPRKFWWKCSRGHEWQSARVRLGKVVNCPYCTGTKATYDNNLSVTHPELVIQYHSTKNSVPIEKIRHGSRTHRWWMCEKGHEWQATVSSRSRATKGTGCPECSPTPRTSKLEVEIREALTSAKVLTDIQTTYNAFINTSNNKKVAVDILGISDNGKSVVVEYDSWWWHSGGGREEYQIPEDRDIRKTQALLDSGYIVIRIREIRSDTFLPFLPISHSNLLQIGWNQMEGISVLVEKIRVDLK